MTVAPVPAAQWSVARTQKRHCYAGRRSRTECERPALKQPNCSRVALAPRHRRMREPSAAAGAVVVGGGGGTDHDETEGEGNGEGEEEEGEEEAQLRRRAFNEQISNRLSACVDRGGRSLPPSRTLRPLRRPQRLRAHPTAQPGARRLLGVRCSRRRGRQRAARASSWLSFSLLLLLLLRLRLLLRFCSNGHRKRVYLSRLTWSDVAQVSARRTRRRTCLRTSNDSSANDDDDDDDGDDDENEAELLRNKSTKQTGDRSSRQRADARANLLLLRPNETIKSISPPNNNNNNESKLGQPQANVREEAKESLVRSEDEEKVEIFRSRTRRREDRHEDVAAVNDDDEANVLQATSIRGINKERTCCRQSPLASRAMALSTTAAVGSRRRARAHSKSRQSHMCPLLRCSGEQAKASTGPSPPQLTTTISIWSLAASLATLLAFVTALGGAQILTGGSGAGAHNKLLASTRKLSIGAGGSATGASALAGASNGAQNNGKLLVCYYTNWSQYRPKEGKYVPEDIDPHLCTHLIVAFGWMKKNRLTPFDASDESKDGKKGLYERVTSLKQVNPNLKVLIAVGGWSFGTERFKSMAANRYNRQLFIFSALEFLRERNFDGLDIDWEFPRADDKKNFVDLLKELREAFDAEAKDKRLPKLLLTCAVSAGAETVRGGYDVAPIGLYSDFINIMSYDFHGKWESKTGHNAPLFASSGESEWRKQLSMDFGVKLWERMGAPKSKLVVGLSTYGRSFTLSNQAQHGMNAPTSGGGKAGEFTKESGFLAYYEICDMLKQGGSYYWDEEQAVPYAVHGDQWVGFDDELSIRNKVKWINEQGYAGAMVWALDMDDFKGTCTPKKYPLIRAMAEGLFNLPTRPSQEWRLIIEAARQRAASVGATGALFGGAAGGSSLAAGGAAGGLNGGSALAVPSMVKPQTSGLTPSELATVIVSSAGITNPTTAEAIRTAIVALAGSTLTQTTAAATATTTSGLQASSSAQQVVAAGNELALTLRNIPGLNMTSLLSSPSAQAALASANPQLAAVLAAAALAQNKSLDSTNARIVCYYTNWSYKRPGSGRFGPENLDPNLCTHIIYAFYGLKDSKLVPTEEIDNSDNEQAPYRRIVALKQLNPNLKVMLAVGGWMMGYAPFRQLTENAYRQTLFTFEVIEFLRKRQFDGLDLCWEFPRGLDDKEKFSNLVKELRDSFEGEAKSSGKPRLLLSAAVPASFEAIAAGYDVPTINKYLDFMNVMTYDFHGDWEQVVGHNSPLFPLNSATAYQKKLTLDFSASEWIRQGASKENLVIGLPTYGRTFTLSNPNLTDIDAPAARGGKPGAFTKESGFLSFFEVCDMLKNQATLVWDNEQMIPYAYKGDQWVGFDDPRSFKMKVQWLKQNGYSGIMIWSIDMDDFAGTCMGLRYPLIKSAKEELKGYYVPNLVESAQGSSLFPSINGLKDKDELLCEEADGHITYHKDKKDCTHYYMCEGSRKHHMPCPQNLVFNVNENVCDWPENVEGCGTKAPATTSA